jgi:hypothetical protein
MPTCLRQSRIDGLPLARRTACIRPHVEPEVDRAGKRGGVTALDLAQVVQRVVPPSEEPGPTT